MEEIYLASGWFSPFESLIKTKMINAVKREFPEEIKFDPAGTKASKRFNVEHTAALAEQIYKDNVNAIERCTYLIYPKDTQDLGTLSDLGIGIRNRKRILSYDYLDDSITELDPKEVAAINLDPNGACIIGVTNLAAGVALGYNYKSPYQICYYLEEGFPDNLMLSMKFTKVKIEDGIVILDNVKKEGDSIITGGKENRFVDNPQNFPIYDNITVPLLFDDNKIKLTTGVS